MEVNLLRLDNIDNRCRLPFIYFLMLVSVIEFAFYFQVPMYWPCPPVGAEPFRLISLQPFIGYQWKAYVLPCVVLWPMPGVH